jgi:putative ABC transport system permease protein
VVVAILTFVLLRTLIWSWTAAIEQSSTDRIGIRHRISFTKSMPKKYLQEVRDTPGVTAAAYATWFAGKYPKRENDFFATIAVEPTDFLNVFDELRVLAGSAADWKQNRRGVLVGDSLAKKHGWKVGDKVLLRGTIYPGDWEFEISGIYTALRASVDRSTFYFHWGYLNDALPARTKDQIGWIAARIGAAAGTADICRRVDDKFAERDVQTTCMSAKAMEAEKRGMLSALLRAIDVVSIVILLIMTAILGNTIAMGVRERTSEYGMLRALGFMPKQIVLFVLGESLVIGMLGAGLALLISYPFVNGLVGRFLEENMGFFFSEFSVQPLLAVQAIAIALLLSAVAGAIPAYSTTRLSAVDALRRVG